MLDVTVLVGGFARVLVELEVTDPAVWRRYSMLALSALRAWHPRASAVLLTVSSSATQPTSRSRGFAAAPRRSRMICWSSRETCIWVTPSSAPISAWLFSSKKRR